MGNVKAHIDRERWQQLHVWLVRRRQYLSDEMCAIPISSRFAWGELFNRDCELRVVLEQMEAREKEHAAEIKAGKFDKPEPKETSH